MSALQGIIKKGQNPVPVIRMDMLEKTLQGGFERIGLMPQKHICRPGPPQNFFPFFLFTFQHMNQFFEKSKYT